MRMIKKLDGMLVATFLTTILYSSTYPFIHKVVMMVISDRIIAIEQILGCLSVIIFSNLWNKFSERLFNYYHLYCIFEMIFMISNMVFTIITNNILTYYIFEAIIVALITRNIVCGNVKLRAIRYNSEDKREHFDNNTSSISAIATILGSLIAIYLSLDFKYMLIIATIGNIVDNVFYIYIFMNTKKNRKKVIKNESN